jgi:hypothetical protein
MHAINGTHCTLRNLLDNELAATRTYQLVLDVLADAPGAVDLRPIHEEHREAADTLRLQIFEIGGEPEHSSCTPDSWSVIVEQAPARQEPRVAAMTLKQGEEVGVTNYETALRNDHLTTHFKMIIHDRLLPHTREHVATLERILEIL